MKIRPATADDAMDLLAWRNDPVTRAMSGDSAEIGRDAHLAWFARALADPDRVIYVAETGGAKIGMARFDRDGAAWIASVAVAPDHRGKGHGAALMRLALADLLAKRPGDVFARVREGNAASLRLFEGLGFKTVAHADGFVLTHLKQE